MPREREIRRPAAPTSCRHAVSVRNPSATMGRQCEPSSLLTLWITATTSRSARRSSTSEAVNIIQAKSLLRFWSGLHPNGQSCECCPARNPQRRSRPALWYSLRDRQFVSWRSQSVGTTLMNTGREIRSYDYVNHPYDRVRDTLKQNALAVFQSATKAAASRAESVAAELHVDFAGIGVKADIKILVKGIEEKARRCHFQRQHDIAPGVGGRNLAAVVSSHAGRAFRLPADRDRNPVGFLRDLRTTIRCRGKDHERDRRPSHRGGFGASLRQ